MTEKYRLVLKDVKLKDRDIQMLVVYRLKNNKNKCRIEILFFDGLPTIVELKCSEVKDYIDNLKKKSCDFYIKDDDNIYLGGK